MVESPPRHVPIFLNARRVLWRNAARALCAVAAVQGVTLVGRDVVRSQVKFSELGV